MAGLSTLRDFADDGLSAISHELDHLIDWCRQWCLETGDARYCVLAHMLDTVNAWWARHDESGGVPASVVATLDDLIKEKLPAVLEEATSAAGTRAADSLRIEVEQLLTEPSNW